MQPVGSYCTDISRCTVNKTLNLLEHMLMSQKACIITKCVEGSPWKAGHSSVAKKLPAFCGTRKFCLFHKSPSLLRVLSRNRKFSSMKESLKKFIASDLAKKNISVSQTPALSQSNPRSFLPFFKSTLSHLLPHTTKFSNWSLSFKFPHPNPACTYTCYMSRQSDPPSLDHPHNIR